MWIVHTTSRHLIEEIDSRISIEYYIDENRNLFFMDKFYRSSLLNYINCEKFIILNSTVSGESVYRKCQRFNFKKNDNFFDIRADIGKNYLDYLQKIDSHLDFTPIERSDCPELYEDQVNHESTPFQDASLECVFEELDLLLNIEKSFFDYGCGKGQILLWAGLHGYKSLGGIDLNPDCANIARRNMERLGYAAEIITGDATVYQNIDNYNIFYILKSRYFIPRTIKQGPSHAYIRTVSSVCRLSQTDDGPCLAAGSIQ